MKYSDWLKRRNQINQPIGIEAGSLHSILFPYQRDIVRWALIRGRACIFADTGLGKTLMQCEWARHIPGRVLILAPLSVAQQTVKEAQKIGLDIAYDRSGNSAAQVVITNYEMMEHSNFGDFTGIVLDESSILKNYSGRIRNQIIQSADVVPYRLACTATPAPNDHMELGNHSEFLGVKTRVEMLSEYFVHDGGSTQNWRLKGHCKNLFWKWVCSWAAMIKRPSDFGYSNEGFNLPPLIEELVEFPVDDSDAREAGLLFAEAARSLSDQRAVRRSTTEARARIISEMAPKDEPVLIWCEYNDEADLITSSIPDAVQIAGSDTIDSKIDKLNGFAECRYRVLVTKPSIAGFGLNWQHCACMFFAGPSHSFEQTYQSIRRCWRFGQTRPVKVYTIAAETETAVIENYKRKQAEAEEMAERMVEHINAKSYQKAVITAKREWNAYEPSKKMEVPSWLAY